MRSSGCSRATDSFRNRASRRRGPGQHDPRKRVSAQALPSLTVVRGAPLPRRRCRGWPKPASGLSGATRQANVQLSRPPRCMRSDSLFPGGRSSRPRDRGPEPSRHARAGYFADRAEILRFTRLAGSHDEARRALGARRCCPREGATRARVSAGEAPGEGVRR